MSGDARAAAMRIGLFEVGGAGWIAGSIYVENIIRAVGYLSAAERPALLLLESERVRGSLNGLPPWVARVEYTHLARGSRRARLTRGLAAIRRLRWPISAECAARDFGAACLFPAPSPRLGGHSTSVGWIPDFQFLHLPEFWPEPHLTRYRNHIRHLLDRYPHLVVSSDDAMQDLESWHSRPQNTVSVLQFASVPGDDWFAASPQTVRERYGLPERYLMFPSQLWQHKGHRILFETVRRLKQLGHADICLVCTGAQADYRRQSYVEGLLAELREWDSGQHVRLLGLLPRTEQIQLMRCAAAIVQPSLFEGWSALLEDCRCLGKRVYATDLRVHREQAVEATWFPAGDADALTDILAAEWPLLPPGPDHRAEAEARRVMAERIPAFARCFLSIMQQAGA